MASASMPPRFFFHHTVIPTTLTIPSSTRMPQPMSAKRMHPLRSPFWRGGGGGMCEAGRELCGSLIGKSAWWIGGRAERGAEEWVAAGAVVQRGGSILLERLQHARLLAPGDGLQ